MCLYLYMHTCAHTCRHAYAYIHTFITYCCTAQRCLRSTMYVLVLIHAHMHTYTQTCIRIHTHIHYLLLYCTALLKSDHLCISSALVNFGPKGSTSCKKTCLYIYTHIYIYMGNIYFIHERMHTYMCA